MTPDDVDQHPPQAAPDDDIRMLALTMERMATELTQIKTRLDRSESLLEAIANRLAALTSRDRPQPVTKEDLQPVLVGLLRHLQSQGRSIGSGP